MTVQRSHVVNPYAKKASRPPLRATIQPQHAAGMGIQSQNRVSNTKRKYQLASSNPHKNRRVGQLTLTGKSAFDPSLDCKVCAAKLKKIFNPEVAIPKRAHHMLCPRNTKTQGKGPISKQQEATMAEEKTLKALYSAPLEYHGKGSAVNTKEVASGFFDVKTKSKQPRASVCLAAAQEDVDFCQPVSMMVAMDSFREKHKSKGAPLAMLAFATVVRDVVMSSVDNRTI